MVVVSGNKLLLRQRPPEGFLGGLWEFPAADCPGNLAPEDVASGLLQDLHLQGELTGLVDVSHAYSHFRLELAVFLARAEPVPGVAEPSHRRWVAEGDVASLALHGAHKKILPALKLA